MLGISIIKKKRKEKPGGTILVNSDKETFYMFKKEDELSINCKNVLE
uniref:Uncharacterized protein n=1 Tax=Rhizophora mucronata TaxID=61149 RepID=A0A2P2MJC1_RHIMU